MQSMNGVVLGALLLAAFLAVLAVMLWKNAGARRVAGEVVYVIEDAVEFISAEFGDDATLAPADVRRILEWEVHFLQMQARSAHRAGGGDIIAGGTDQAVEYIQAQAAAKQQAVHSTDQIRSVLAGEASYLVSIGAVGEVAT